MQPRETTFGEFIRLHVVLHDYAASSLATNLHNIDRKKPILAFLYVEVNDSLIVLLLREGKKCNSKAKAKMQCLNYYTF